MIKNIVFDMGNVLLRFEPELFIERLGVTPEDRRTLLIEVFRSLEWAKMDRGSLNERQAAELICRRVPERLHSAVHSLTDQWERPILPVEGSYELVEELKEKIDVQVRVSRGNNGVSTMEGPGISRGGKKKEIKSLLEV